MRAKGQPIPPPPVSTRVVRCYHCLRECEVSAHAMSSSCPHCHRQLAIADIIVRDRHWGGRLQTCGRILIDRSARVQVNCVQASGGIELQGSLKGRIVSYGPVVLGEGCTLEGDLEAPAVYVAPGARIVGGRFSISPVRVSK
ncbi:MAG TPA: polymer-forming cytoskeletal protein [Phycisphaerales bacterium]|nr:polymer-forming cytoskeletal protein [Phycisphaerales bacterium]